MIAEDKNFSNFSAMLAGDPGSIPGYANNSSNFSEVIGKPL